MAKYKVTRPNLRQKGKAVKIGSVIDLDEEQLAGVANKVEPLEVVEVPVEETTEEPKTAEEQREILVKLGVTLEGDESDEDIAALYEASLEK